MLFPPGLPQGGCDGGAELRGSRAADGVSLRPQVSTACPAYVRLHGAASYATGAYSRRELLSVADQVKSFRQVLFLMNGTKWARRDNTPRACAALAAARDEYGCPVCMALVIVLALRAQGWRELPHPVPICDNGGSGRT